MDDLISRQAAIDASKASMSQPVREKGMEREVLDELVKRLREPCQYENCILCQQAADVIEELMRRCEQSAQPTQNNDSNALEVLDCVSRQAAIDAIHRDANPFLEYAASQIENLPSAQPTLYGYSIEHLALIAIVMQKEHVTPEKALEYFKDIQRMGQMIVDEQQEMIKRAVEKWTI